MAISEEERQRRLEQLARGRATRDANIAARKAKAAEADAAQDDPEPEPSSEPKVERVMPPGMAEMMVAPPEPEAVPEKRADEVELTDEQLERIRVEARKKIEAEILGAREIKLKSLMAEELDREILTQRRLAGLTNHQDDIIEFLVNVGPFADRVVVDGKVYTHGQWVKTTRREYDSIRDIMARSWESEDRAGNPNKKFEMERRLVGVQNPMMMETRLPDGSFTIGLGMGSVNGRTGATSRSF